MMTRATITARLLPLVAAAGVSLAALAGLATAQGTPPPAPSGATQPSGSTATRPAAEPPRVVSRRILPDGVVELTYSDGTTRRVSPESGSAAGDDLSPVAPPEWLKDEGTNKAFLEAMGEYYRYRSSGLRHRSRVFEWQLASSKVIFTTVLMLVAAGMVFAAIQFRVGLRRPEGAPADVPTQVDVSAAGVKVTSPVLGVIILVISLAFFYLYLVYVYPISEIV
jgi:hypothetical protein